MIFYAFVGLVVVGVGWFVARCISIMRLHDRIKTGF